MEESWSQTPIKKSVFSLKYLLTPETQVLRYEYDKYNGKAVEGMKVYRLYVDGECVGTYGDGPAARTMAMLAMGDWFDAGYDADRCKIRYEEYQEVSVWS